MPETGPGWGAVLGGAGCLRCREGEAGLWEPCACSECEYTFQSPAEMLCVLSIVLCHLAGCLS